MQGRAHQLTAGTELFLPSGAPLGPEGINRLMLRWKAPNQGCLGQGSWEPALGGGNPTIEAHTRKGDDMYACTSMCWQGELHPEGLEVWGSHAG